MKRTTLSILMMAIVLATHAQKATISLKSGVNLSEVSTGDAVEDRAIGIRPAFHLGMVLDIPLGAKFSFQPQLLYSGRGAREAHDDHKDVFRFNSIEVPLNIVYRSQPTSGGGWFFGAGPGIGYNISGKVVATDDPSETEAFEFGSVAGTIRRMDLGLNLITGYGFKNGVFVSANYNRGITNWLNAGGEWRNNLLGISFGKKL